jgi:hypothetical protein
MRRRPGPTLLLGSSYRASPLLGEPRSLDRARADRKASGISRRDDSTSSYRNARSAKGTIGRSRSKSPKRYSSSSGSLAVGSSEPDASYRPWPIRLTSPSRTSRVRENVIADRLASGIAVTISRADTGRFAATVYSYTRWMIALNPLDGGSSLSFVNSVSLTNDNTKPWRVHV